MLNNLIIWVMTQRMMHIIRLIVVHTKMSHLDDVGNQRRISMLQKKYNYLGDRRALRIHRSLKPISRAQYVARYMCMYLLASGVCLFLLVYFTIRGL